MLSRLGTALEQLPVLPEIPRRIVAMAHDPLASLSDIAAVMSEDAVMTMKVMKLANSVFYAGVQEITSLDSACSRLGLKTILKIAHTVAGHSIYRSPTSVFREPMEQAWRHAIASAYCAGEIAMLSPGVPTDEAFLAGLIHDVGRVVLLDILASLYESTPPPNSDSLDTCLHIVASYRAVAGLHVVQQWNLPAEFRVSTLCHTKPEAVPFEECWRMTHTVSLAERLAETSGYACESIEDAITIENHPSLAALHLTAEGLSAMQVDLKDRIETLVDV